MSERLGALLVRRVRPRAEKLTTKPRNAAVDLSEDQVARAYRGIDGRPWPEELPVSIEHSGGLAPIESWPHLVTIAGDHSNATVYDAVILAVRSSLPIRVPEAVFLGFDFGFYDDEYSVFSSLYHEAIHSPLEELRRFARRLNASLLLPDAEAVEAYRRSRDSLRASGRDVEDQDCYPIAVFGRPR